MAHTSSTRRPSDLSHPCATPYSEPRRRCRTWSHLLSRRRRCSPTHPAPPPFSHVPWPTPARLNHPARVVASEPENCVPRLPVFGIRTRATPSRRIAAKRCLCRVRFGERASALAVPRSTRRREGALRTASRGLHGRMLGAALATRACSRQASGLVAEQSGRQRVPSRPTVGRLPRRSRSRGRRRRRSRLRRGRSRSDSRHLRLDQHTGQALGRRS